MANINLDAWQDGWALVTGASSGIGRAFALALAARGLNVILVARRRDRLEQLAAEIVGRHQVQTRVIPMDLAEPGAAPELHRQTVALNIAVRALINNAGAGFWGPFERHDATEHAREVQLVAVTPIALCREFLPDLRRHPEALIINVTSPAAYQPVPYMAAYAAAKACLHHFSLALYEELRKTGVLVRTVVPAPTLSEFDDKAGAYQSGVGEERRPPEEVVARALSELNQDRALAGNAKGVYKQRWFAGLFPERFVVKTVAKMFAPPIDQAAKRTGN